MVFCNITEFKGPDNIYWLFSSAAQSIAAFIGFLATGLFFSFDRLDRATEKDDTLEEINQEIKKEYFSRAKGLFVITCFSIVFSLGVVYTNGLDMGKYALYIWIVVGVLDIFTILWALGFVIFIIDPAKVRKTGKKMVAEDQTLAASTGSNVALFMTRFVELEKVLRSLAKSQDFGFRGRSAEHTPLSFLIGGLYRSEKITNPEFGQLRELIKARNLIVHGALDNIDRDLVNKTETLTSELSKRVKQ
jgi:heme exporter protein D